MSSYRPIDSKREEFRKYLERTGVMDALTKVLVLLYEQPDKPEDALDFMRSNLGDKRPSASEIENMQSELEDAHRTIKDLEKQLSFTKSSLAQARNQLALYQQAKSKGNRKTTPGDETSEGEAAEPSDY